MGQPVKTRIIEFNGLPGCGKTTLATGLKEELISRGYRVILSNEANIKFKEHIFKNTISCFSISLVFLYIKLFFAIGKRKENKWYIYRTAAKISLVFRWCLKSGEFDFILCDHGLIQNTVSLLGFDEPKDYEKFSECLASVLKVESDICVINCNVSIEQSMERIRLRNKTTGRLDVVNDDLELGKLLRITENNFCTVRNIVKRVRKEWSTINLAMDIPSHIVVQTMLNFISKWSVYNEC